MVLIFQDLTGLPRKAAIQTKRDLTVEVSQKDLKGFNSRFIWIEGLDKSEILGEIKDFAAQTGVEPVRVPGYWLHKDGFEWLPGHEKASKDEKVLLHFHGGAYTVSTVIYQLGGR